MAYFAGRWLPRFGGMRLDQMLARLAHGRAAFSQCLAMDNLLLSAWIVIYVGVWFWLLALQRLR
jgi:uncharacterized membrane protein